jgi:Xaa-Pro aminopeptidase
MDFQARRDRLRKAFPTVGIDALLVTDFTNVTYLTGFTGDDSYLLVRRDGETVLSDPDRPV